MLRLIEQLKRDEGLRLQAYRDHLGYLTIGYGRLIDEQKGGGITEAEAEYLLSNDIKRTVSDLERRYDGWDSLPEKCQHALINMAFQLGVNGLLAFKNMQAALLEKDYKRAALEALNSRWAKQTPARASRIAAMIASCQ